MAYNHINNNKKKKRRRRLWRRLRRKNSNSIGIHTHEYENYVDRFECRQSFLLITWFNISKYANMFIDMYAKWAMIIYMYIVDRQHIHIAQVRRSSNKYNSCAPKQERKKIHSAQPKRALTYKKTIITKMLMVRQSVCRLPTIDRLHMYSMYYVPIWSNALTIRMHCINARLCICFCSFANKSKMNWPLELLSTRTTQII